MMIGNATTEETFNSMWKKGTSSCTVKRSKVTSRFEFWKPKHRAKVISSRSYCWNTQANSRARSKQPGTPTHQVQLLWKQLPACLPANSHQRFSVPDAISHIAEFVCCSVHPIWLLTCWWCSRTCSSITCFLFIKMVASSQLHWMMKDFAEQRIFWAYCNSFIGSAAWSASRRTRSALRT